MHLPGFGSCVLVIGAFIALCAVLLLYDILRFLRLAVRSEGKVVGYETEKGNDGGDSFYVRVYFRDTDGTERVVTVRNIGSGMREFDDGSRVSIMFDPNNPQDTRIASFAGIWSPLVVTSVAAGIALAIGASALIFE